MADGNPPLPLSNPRTFRCVSIADEMNPRKRNTMEDVHRIIPLFDGDHNTSFFGVYDGHGGRGIVDFLETRLEENIAAELRETDDAGIGERIRRAYLATDVESKAAQLITSGATAVTCLLRREGGQDGKLMLYSTNVGDSRAVLFTEGKALRLTHDHKAEDKQEQQRVEKAGGFILRNRVLGILAVARSFGDHGMKEFVTAEPHCSERQIGASDPFFIMACDGVWDCLDDEGACQLVRAEAEAGREDQAARVLVNEALRRGSTDNITCIVIFF